MSHPRLALLALSAGTCALLVGATAEPLSPPAATATVRVPAQPPSPPPPAAPPLLLLPRAEASPRRVPDVTEPEVPDLRAEGKQHVLERTADGIVLTSAQRGVLGFMKNPAPSAPIRWAGFVDDDAILIATTNTLHRAATPEDAIAGKFEALDKLDPAATLLASANQLVVAAVPGPDGAYYESRDGGRHFTPAKRPAKQALVGLTVRSDGVIVAAIEKEQVEDERGHQEGVGAQIVTAKRPGAWTVGPLADVPYYGSVLTHHGDSIMVESPRKKQPDEYNTLGLDAKGRWTPAVSPGSWLSSRLTDNLVRIGASSERPGFPKPSKGGGSGGRRKIGCAGLGLSSGHVCHGASCLGHRAMLGPQPIARAFHDGVCRKKHVAPHTRTVQDFDEDACVSVAKTVTTDECNKSAPAQRTSTLLLRDGDERRVARLPSTCATGEVTGSGRASFVYCSAEHQGRPSILHVSPLGAFTEVASGIAGDLDVLGAESASDGTTVIFAKKAAWLCGAPGACVSVPHEHFLAARPLPFGRALVARSAGEHALQLELFGEPGAQPLRIVVSDNVIELETTAEGNVRLWTSRTMGWLASPAWMADLKGEPPVDAFLVRADGQLIPDLAAKEALLREVAAARAAR